MAEYIERGGELFPTPFSSEEHGDYRQGWNHCLRAIYQQPAVDVVKVVRCRECIFRNYYKELDGTKICICTGAMAYTCTPDDWYCANGKRKKEGQNE